MVLADELMGFECGSFEITVSAALLCVYEQRNLLTLRWAIDVELKTPEAEGYSVGLDKHIALNDCGCRYLRGRWWFLIGEIVGTRTSLVTGF